MRAERVPEEATGADWKGEVAEKSVGKAFDFIMTIVDPGVATLIGSIGEIPLVGGVIAGGLTLAYSIGRTLLRSTVIEKVTDLVFTKLVGPMIEKGIPAAIKWIQSTPAAAEPPELQR